MKNKIIFVSIMYVNIILTGGMLSRLILPDRDVYVYVDGVGETPIKIPSLETLKIQLEEDNTAEQKIKEGLLQTNLLASFADKELTKEDIEKELDCYNQIGVNLFTSHKFNIKSPSEVEVCEYELKLAKIKQLAMSLLTKNEKQL